MAINDMTVEQSNTILSGVLSQAQGGAAVTTPTNAADFVTVAQLALKTGYDTLSTALSQVLSRTIFAVRPYQRKFQILERNREEWGNHVRKINYVDGALESNPAYSLADGYSIDMYSVKKPRVVQTNFYGKNTFAYHQTVYKQQLKTALRGPEEWNSFLGGLMTHVRNLMEKTHEESARLAICNLIAGTVEADAANSGANKNVVYLITEYNNDTGESITANTVFDPTIFPNFARWFFGRLTTASRMMSERSQLYHQNLSGLSPTATFERQTAPADQRLIMLAPLINKLDAEVLSTTYNSEYLRTIPREEIGFWQNIGSPYKINTACSYLDTSGVIQEPLSATSLDGVVAVLFDRDACGYTMMNEAYEVTPYNTAGQYYNHWWSFEDRYYNDFTENAIVFLLAEEPTGT